MRDAARAQGVLRRHDSVPSSNVLSIP
jgi:hypothetical protein